MIPVHDNFVYGCSLNYEDQRITLHTIYLDSSPQQYTDVVFRGVVAHFFQRALAGNILFNIAQIAADAIVDGHASIFEESWRYGWPPLDYRGDLSLLKDALRRDGVLGFDVRSSYGLSGWVLCTSSERLHRDCKVHIP